MTTDNIIFDIDKVTAGLNEVQKTAVLNPCDSCTKIVAGAGTGKTKIISKRFVKLVMELSAKNIENPQNKILVITFTDKAANEMKSRIVNEAEMNNIKISEASELWVSTFHSFCMKILKKYSIEAGLSPSFKMAEEQQLKDIYDKLIKHIKYDEAFSINNFAEIMHKNSIESDILSVKNLSQLTQIDDIDVIFENIYLTIKKIKSLGISSKEFLQNSLNSITDFSHTVENTPFKFDSKDDYAAAWAENYKSYIDNKTVFDSNIFDEIAKTKLILDKNGKRKATEYGMAKGFPENIAPVTKIELYLTKVIAAIYALYQAELENLDIADFDDLINKTIQIFKENESVRAHYQNYFQQIIVDEFQDTNGAQLELIELLLNPNYPNLTFVGDRKQSIYAFRYAQTENLDVLQKEVENRYNKKYEPLNLSINYRSTPEVLHAVNYVTTQELNLKDEVLNPNPNIEFEDTKKDIKVTVIDDQTNAYDIKIAEAQYISDEIKMLISRDNASYKDFAILVKSHSQADLIEKELKKNKIPSIKKVNTGFFKKPVVKNAISAFQLIQNAQDEQSLIRLLKANMPDSEIYKLKKTIDKSLLKTLEFEEIKRLNFAQKYLTADCKDIENPYIKTIYDFVEEMRKAKGSLSLLQIFEKIKRNIVLYPQDKNIEIWQIESNLKILETIIDDFEQNENYISISGLLKYLEKISDDRNFELPAVSTEEIDAVQILTIHASKGLEFPYLFVLSIKSASKNSDKNVIGFDMQYGDKPGFGIIAKKHKGKVTPKSVIYKSVWATPRAKQEELRLFYVAVSRAKKYLNVLSFEPYSSVKPAEYISNLNDYLSC